MDFKKSFLIIPFLILILLTVTVVSADENITEDVAVPSQDIEIPIAESIVNESSQIIKNPQVNTKMESKDVTTYHKENAELVGYLKDTSNQPIANKPVSIFINDKIYNKMTDNFGKVVLKLDLKPNTYKATIKFDGDANYTASVANVIVTVKNAPLAIKTSNYKTFVDSGLYFKAKVFNKITKTPIKGVKVMFKVYMGHNKYKKYMQQLTREVLQS